MTASNVRSLLRIRVGKIPLSKEAQRIMGAMRVQKMMLMRIKLKGRAGRPRQEGLRQLAKRYKYMGNVAISDHAEVKGLIHILLGTANKNGKKLSNPAFT